MRLDTIIEMKDENDESAENELNATEVTKTYSPLIVEERERCQFSKLLFVIFIVAFIVIALCVTVILIANKYDKTLTNQEKTNVVKYGVILVMIPLSILILYSCFLCVPLTIFYYKQIFPNKINKK